MYDLNFKDEDDLLKYINDNIPYNFTITITKDNSGARVLTADIQSEIDCLNETIIDLNASISELEDELAEARETIYSLEEEEDW